MSVEQTVEIPPSRRLFVEVPQEVPIGKTILTYTSISADEDLHYACRIWSDNRAKSDELKARLQKLQGSLGKNTFDAMDGVAYQQKVREEWDD